LFFLFEFLDNIVAFLSTTKTFFLLYPTGFATFFFPGKKVFFSFLKVDLQTTSYLRQLNWRDNVVTFQLILLHIFCVPPSLLLFLLYLKCNKHKYNEDIICPIYIKDQISTSNGCTTFFSSHIDLASREIFINSRLFWDDKNNLMFILHATSCFDIAEKISIDLLSMRPREKNKMKLAILWGQKSMQTPST